MEWKYFRLAIRIFFGVCLLMASAAILIYNVFFLEAGYDVTLGLLDLFLFLLGLLLVVFAVARMPKEEP